MLVGTAFRSTRVSIRPQAPWVSLHVSGFYEDLPENRDDIMAEPCTLVGFDSEMVLEKNY